MSGVLVTGGCGFIGSHVVDLLLEKGYNVTVVDNLDTGKLVNLEHLKPYQNPQLKLCITEFDSDRILNQVKNGMYEYVLHLAAKASVPFSVDNPYRSNDVNVTKTLSLLEACKAGKVKKFVFSSSSSVYGDAGVFPTKESTVKNPMSPYALQKSVIEDYCKLFNSLYGIESVCLRYFNVFGPRQAGSGPYANVVSSWCENGIKHKKIRLDGKGEATRDFVYVKDVAYANLLAMTSNLKHTSINIGSGSSVAIKDILTTFQEHFDVQVTDAPARLGDPLHTLADVSLAKTLLGFEPTKVTSDLFCETFDWYKENVK